MSPYTSPCPGGCVCRVRWDRVVCGRCWLHLPSRLRTAFQTAVSALDRPAITAAELSIVEWIKHHPAPRHAEQWQAVVGT